ncbi:MAG: hypothetical protein P4L33_10885 [Capsulimonadaceae bacterium]|nr:hypothetical protein [Capsulimonadaceae bacterium]
MAGWFASHPGDFRILQQALPYNSAMSFGRYEAWGYDPGVQRRYAEFVLAAEHLDPNSPLTNVPLAYPAPALRLLRCRYYFVPAGKQIAVGEIPGALPEGLLVHEVRIVQDRMTELRQLQDPGFSSDQKVLIEKMPTALPQPAVFPEDVVVTHKDSDTLEIAASASSSGMLLITDAYSRFWKVRAMPDSVQQSYDIVPGDYALIAIRVEKGNHHFTLTYEPPLFRLGAALSALGLAVFFGLLYVTCRKPPLARLRTEQ